MSAPTVKESLNSVVVVEPVALVRRTNSVPAENPPASTELILSKSRFKVSGPVPLKVPTK
jgi:hypothetical protein